MLARRLRAKWKCRRRFVAMSTFVGIALIVCSATRVAAADLTAAEAAAKKAADEEGAIWTEWNSLEMSRSATREIARSERQRTEEVLQSLIALQGALKNAEAAGSDVEAVRKELEQKSATMRSAAERLMTETDTANRATDQLYPSEDAYRDKMAARRAAECAVLEIKAQDAEKAGTADADAARKAVFESQCLAAWERQQWAAVQISTTHQLVEQAAGAADIAGRIAAVETDAQSKSRLAEFVKAQQAVKAAADQRIARKNAEIEAATAEIYPLRAAAIGGLTPLPPQEWNREKARHLLVRAGFGGTPQEVDALCAMGLYKAVDHLVEFYRRPAADAPFEVVPPIPADALEGKLRGDFIRGQVAGARAGVERGQMGQLRQWWLKRMVESPRPLQEKLTLLWHGHFATQDSVVQNSYAMYHQNQLLRENAAGNFGALLYGVVHDPAMLRYLDNNRNVKGSPNENLAREIMELFSMGVNQGYTEADIVQAARTLTGYTFGGAGSFRVVQSAHDTDEKTVFGAKGPWNGDDLVRLILAQPATARFVSTKLWEFFAYDEPSTETVDRLATVLRYHNYELEPALKNLFLSAEFYGARAVGTQIKCPIQLAVGALRDLGVKRLSNYGGLEGALREMGQDVFEPPDVKGWRYGQSWISTARLFTRYNAVADAVRGVPQPGRSGVDLVAFVQAGGPEAVSHPAGYLSKACFSPPLAEERLKDFADLERDLPAADQWSSRRDETNAKLQELLIVMLSIPDYQFN